MARIRTIKPEFPQSETIGSISRDARLLFIQLWTVVDDAGRARAASRLLAGVLYPYDEDAPALIDAWLGELEDAGLVRIYRIDGTQLLDIPNWRRHQKIDKPSPSKLPEFDEASRIFARAREGSRGFSQGAREGRDTTEAARAPSGDPESAKHGDLPQPIENTQFDEVSRGLANAREASMLDLGPRTKERTSSLRSDGASAPQAAMLAEAMGASPGADDTPRGRLWRDGLATLARLTSKSPKSLRSLIGKWRDELAKAPGVVEPEAELLAIIAKADAETPSEPVPWIAGTIRARHRPASPCPNDDAEAWEGIADSIDLDPETGRKRPAVNGLWLDHYASEVLDAAGLPQTWRGEWSPLVGWLRDGIDDDHDVIVPTIRRVASRPGYQPPGSLAFFDKAIRGAQPARRAG